MSLVVLALGLRDMDLTAIINGILKEPVAVATWALAIATIALVFAALKSNKNQANAQREIFQLQKQTVEFEEYNRLTDKMIQFDQILNEDTANLERTAVYKHVSNEEIHGNFDVIAERVIGRFDRIGSFIRINPKLETPYLKLHAEKTGKSWLYLQEYLVKERQRRNSPEYGGFFEYIGKKSEEFWNSLHPNNPLRIKQLPPK